jgi:erythromycin esterase-like protein/beta-lactamase regulating signal transducer with metallopeptidase domain
MSSILAAVVNGSILSALMAAAMWLALRFAPNRVLNAATRYVIWWATLAVAIALPTFYLPVHAFRAAERTQAPAMAPGAALPVAPLPAPSEAAAEPLPQPRDEPQPPVAAVPPGGPLPPAGPRSFPISIAAGRWPGWIVTAGALMSLLMIVRLIVSYLLLERQKSRAVDTPAHLAARLEEWLARCGSRRRHVRLAISDEISAPMAAGPLRPAILIPARLFDGLEQTELNQVGLHEAAHLARGDDYALIFQRLIEAAFVWHPVIRWITRRIDLEREIACDDIVMGTTGRPRPYAACLTHMAELATAVRTSLAASGAADEGSHLARRVGMLLDATRHNGTRVLRTRLAAVVAGQLAVAWMVAQTPGLFAFAMPAAEAFRAASATERQASPRQAEPARTQEASPSPAAGSPSVQEWIAAHAIRLKTPEARQGFADMQPLKKVIGDARIVALGEATHGTREFFQLKHRMLEFLATEMGFTIFSIEANMPEAYRLNDFVLNGNGDPAKLLKGMYFWTWDTQEVLDMILWMREFNKSGKGRVEFTGFDMQTPTVAADIVRQFAVKHDPEYAPTVDGASTMAASASAPRPSFGSATGSFPVEVAAGKRVRFSGYIKTEGVTGYAGFWWRVDGPSGVLAFANLQDRAPKGTTDWKRYELEIPVAADARNINFGSLLSGEGTAWFDGLSVELDGQPYTDNSLFDFDFELPSLKGFAAGPAGYRAQLDKEVFRSGKQSLRMTCVLPPAAGKSTDSKLAVSTWKDVVQHLETSRAAYREKGAGARDIEWAIQNARVVLQCMQMRANEVTRDRSMADNVKWILDQSPKAKIVLWAHNGHVSTGGYRGYGSMGASLRKMYGDQMVVFGCAFNQGSFQAMERDKGLRDFTVPPAPQGSLDAVFAATGIPLFALDLRQVPKSGAVAEWFSRPQKSRSIGAVYSEETPEAFMSSLKAPDTFDAILFVETTTAARKNTAAATQVPFEVRPLGAQAGQPGADAAGAAREYRDPKYRVSFTLPSGWEVSRSLRWGNEETTVWFSAPGLDSRSPALYYQPQELTEKLSPEEASRTLAARSESKAAQRVNAGLTDYHIRQNSCQPRTVEGRPALSCVGDFTRDGQKMTEYLTFLDGEKTAALFFAMVPATELESFRERFDRIIETLRIP